MKKIICIHLFVFFAILAVATPVKENFDTISQRTKYDDLQSEVVALKTEIIQTRTSYERLYDDYRHMIGWMGLIATIVVAGGGIIAPWLINRGYEKRLEEIEKNAIEENKKSLNEMATKIGIIEGEVTKVNNVISEVERIKELIDAQEKKAKKAAREAKINKMFSEALNEQDLNKRVEKYNILIKFDPTNAAAYNNLGVAMLAQKRYNEAILHYNKAIELAPSIAFQYNNRGIVNEKLGNIDEAILDFNKAIELNPEYSDAYYNRGVMYGIKGELNMAILNYDESIKYNPQKSNAYNNRGNIKMQLGSAEDGLRDIEAAICIEEKPAFFDSRAVCHRLMRQLDAAIYDHDKAIGLDKQPIFFKERSLTYRVMADAEADSAKKSEYIANAEADEKRVIELGGCDE